MTSISNSSAPLRVFVSYAHDDRDFKKQFDKNLTVLREQGKISFWSDGEIIPGSHWNQSITDAMMHADIIIFLVSTSFLASDFIRNKEVPLAMERVRAGTAILVPVILKETPGWEDEDWQICQVLPHEVRPVEDWPSIERGFAEVEKGLRKLIKSQATKLPPGPVGGPPPPSSPPIQVQPLISGRTLTIIGILGLMVGISVLWRSAPPASTVSAPAIPLIPPSTRLLTLTGEEAMPGTKIDAVLHTFPDRGLSMALRVLFANNGDPIEGPLDLEWSLPASLAPSSTVGKSERILDGKDGFSWRHIVPFWDGKIGIPKDAASASHGYFLATISCPLLDKKEMPLDLSSPVRLRLVEHDSGVAVLDSTFSLVLKKEKEPTSPRIEVTSKDFHWLSGPILNAKVGSAMLDLPLSLHVQGLQYQRTGVSGSQVVTSVWLMPEALRPSHEALKGLPPIDSPSWARPAGLRWLHHWSWTYGSDGDDPAPKDTFVAASLDESYLAKRPPSVEPGYYRLKLVQISNENWQSFVDGKAGTPLLTDQDMEVLVAPPESIKPRPALNTVKIQAASVDSWPAVKAIAFEDSELVDEGKFWIFMPLSIKNTGTTDIPMNRFAAYLYFGAPLQVADEGIAAKWCRALRPDESAEQWFTHVTGPWSGLSPTADLVLAPGKTTTIKVFFSLGTSDGLPNAQSPNQTFPIGIKFFLGDDASFTDGEQLFSGHLSLQTEWRQHLDQATFDQFLNQAGAP